MSGALINRSLTTIRTELEFLLDSEVIDQPLYDRLTTAIPLKYAKDLKPWGVEKLGLSESSEPAAAPAYAPPTAAPPSGAPSGPPPADKLANEFARTTISAPPPAELSRSSPQNPVGYCKVSYEYQAVEADDLNLSKGDKLAVTEHLSEDWWKGHKKGSTQVGVFPSNYVSVISQQEFELNSVIRNAVAAPPSEKLEHNYQPLYSPQEYSQPPPQQYSPYQAPQQYPPQQLQQQPSYGGYAQYPPPSTNYYPQQQAPPPQQEPQPEQQLQSSGHLRKFGSKLGNAAIFGAGATIGGDIVNSIF